MAATVGVIALHRDEAGAIHPEALNAYSNTAPRHRGNDFRGQDAGAHGRRVCGRWCCGAIARAWGYGAGTQPLRCRQILKKAMPDSVVYVIDAAKAAALTNAATPGDARHTVVAMSDAGCSPVREAVTADGGTLYLTARGDNTVLAFDARKLETDREHAFLRRFRAEAKLRWGCFLFDGGKSMLVANSNRFTKGNGNAAVFDLSDPAKPYCGELIKTKSFRGIFRHRRMGRRCI